MSAGIRLQIDVREPFAGGMEFGDTGAYERIAGRVRFEIDPTAPENQTIVDLNLAPRTAGGRVEYETDFYFLRPVHLRRGNRRVIYDVNNRGNMRLLQFMNDAIHSNRPSEPGHAGNGFLMRRGYSIVWTGWQGDLLPGDGRLTMRLPVATQSGDPLTGPSRTEYVADEPGITTIPLCANDYTRSYRVTSPENARLTVREYESDPRVEVASAGWQFAKVDETGAVSPSDSHLHLSAGFVPGMIYELVYTARDPEVLGLGFTGVRDLISFLLYQDADDDSLPNPLRDDDGGVEAAYAWGRSQSGRFLREFVYQGFNVDGQGRQVFAGVSPHVSGGGRVWLNGRFAQPGRFPRQHNDHLYPSDQFPFAYGETTDHLTGQTDAILKRPDTDPFVIHTQTSSEYWDRRGSLVHTDTEGNDLPPHPKARNYLFASSQHNADPLLGAAETLWSSAGRRATPADGTAHPTNPLNTTPLLRALLDALDSWARDGITPPAEAIPRRSEGTLVSATEAAECFPSIAGVAHPAEPCRLHLQDFGRRFNDGIIDNEPPEVDLEREYTVLVPATDDTGNEIPGIRTPHIEAPLATYTGWNFRPPGAAADALKGTVGSYFPLASGQDDGDSTDLRMPVGKRYPTVEAYVDCVREAALALIEQRFLLAEDVERYVDAASGIDLE